MSRLDYVTIAIVAICIFAIVFLVVKTSKLMNQEEAGVESNRVEDALANQESSVDDLYDDLAVDTSYQSYKDSRTGAYDGDDQEDSEVDPFDPVDGEQYGDERTTTTKPAPKKEKPTTSTASRQRDELTARGGAAGSSTPSSRQPAATTTRPAAGASPNGQYLVIAGSFRQMSNAEKMVRQLQRLGYEGAEVGSTNAGAYAVAVVDRLNDRESATILVNELKTKHKIDARVQKQ